MLEVLLLLSIQEHDLSRGGGVPAYGGDLVSGVTGAHMCATPESMAQPIAGVV